MVHKGVKIIGPTNVPSRVSTHASQLFSKNMVTFLLNMVKDGELNINMEDPIVSGSLIGKGGEVLHPQVRERLGLEVKASE